MTISFFLFFFATIFQVVPGCAEYGCIFDADFVKKTVAFLDIGHGALLLLNEHNVLLFRVIDYKFKHSTFLLFFFFFFSSKNTKA